MTEHRKQLMCNQIEGTKELKSQVQEVHPESMVGVAEEAMLHIMEHFDIGKDKAFKADFVFIMSNTHIGVSSADPSANLSAVGTYYYGDTNTLSHQLAKMMRVNPEIAHFIYHAVHAYQHGL